MRLNLLLFCLLLTACTTTAPRPPQADEMPQSRDVSIAARDPTFLYLAAEQAILNGRPELAARFLTALLQKDPQAVLPRLQLVDLLLQLQQVDAAEKQARILIQRQDLGAEARAKALLLLARIHAVRGHNDKAIALLQPYLKHHPRADSVRRMLVRLLAAEERYSEAHRQIQEALKRGGDVRLYRLDAELYIREGKLRQAETVLRAMRKRVPDRPEPVVLLSRIAIQQGRNAEAEHLLRDYLKTHPDSLSVSNALGRLLVRQGHLKEAIEIYESISRRTGNRPEVLTALGLLYYQHQDYARAATAFRRALAKSPSNKLRLYLAASLEAEGKNREAARIYRSIKRDTSSYLDARLRLVAIDLQAGRTNAAIAGLRRIIRNYPRSGEAYAMLSSVLLQQKKYRLLLSETAAGMQLPKPPARLLFNRAAAFEGLKKYAAAVALLRKLLASKPDDAEALNFLGYVYAEMGAHLDEAEQLIRRALKKKPGNGYYLDSLAWVFYKRGDYARALKIQRRAVKKIPNDPVMQEHLGDILWHHGEKKAAREAWRKAIRLGHEDPDALRRKIRKGP